MEQELDYAEMLEIPVSTVNVVKKKSIFRRPKKAKEEQDDLKEQVVDSVNERMGAFVSAEDLSELPPPAKAPSVKFGRDKGSIVLITEIVAVCLLAVTIFLTNVFLPNSAINTFISSFMTEEKTETEKTYSQIQLNSVVGDFSDAEITVSPSGVLSFQTESSVYPVCDGTITTITPESDGLYTVEIAHTSTFSSVTTGLTNVYYSVGDSLKGNLPFAYTDGGAAVSVSMYDSQTLLSCFTLSGAVPVWTL